MILPCYPALCLFIGACYTFGIASAYTASPSYHLLLRWLPIHLWGVFWLMLGAMQATAYFSHSRRALVFSLCVGAGAYLSWAAVFAVAWVSVPDALPTGVGLWLFIAYGQYAVCSSLVQDNVIPIGRR